MLTVIFYFEDVEKTRLTFDAAEPYLGAGFVRLLDRKVQCPKCRGVRRDRRRSRRGERPLTKIQTFTIDDLAETLPPDSFTVCCMQKWLARGDGIAVYECRLLGSELLGHRVMVSFGGPDAQLPGDEPPNYLPVGLIRLAWAYTLQGVIPRPTPEEE